MIDILMIYLFLEKNIVLKTMGFHSNKRKR